LKEQRAETGVQGRVAIFHFDCHWPSAQALDPLTRLRAEADVVHGSPLSPSAGVGPSRAGW